MDVRRKGLPSILLSPGAVSEIASLVISFSLSVREQGRDWREIGKTEHLSSANSYLSVVLVYLFWSPEKTKFIVTKRYLSRGYMYLTSVQKISIPVWQAREHRETV